MRRKIEKYLARQQGVDEGKIKLTDDGRYDFMDDLEGVLSAVRGKIGRGGKKRKSDLVKKFVNHAKKSVKLKVSNLEKENGYDSSSLSMKENMKQMKHNVHFSGDRRVLGDVHHLTPKPRNHQICEQSRDSTTLNDDICLLSPEFMMKSSTPHSSVFQSRGQMRNIGTKDSFQGLFSPHLVGINNDISPFSAEGGQYLSSTNGIFSPEAVINRNLFSCPNASIDGFSRNNMPEVSASPIIMSPLHMSESRKRRYFTDQSLDDPIKSLNFTTTPAPVPLSQGSDCLGIVPLRMSKAVTPDDSGDRHMHETNKNKFTQDNPALSF